MRELWLLGAVASILLSVTLKGCAMEEDSYVCQADKFDCVGLEEFCNEKERICKAMRWECRNGQLVCQSESEDMCAQLRVDCSKEKGSSLGKGGSPGSSLIQVAQDDAEDTSPRAFIHRQRKKMTSIGA